MSQDEYAKVDRPPHLADFFGETCVHLEAGATGPTPMAALRDAAARALGVGEEPAATPAQADCLPLVSQPPAPCPRCARFAEAANLFREAVLGGFLDAAAATGLRLAFEQIVAEGRAAAPPPAPEPTDRELARRFLDLWSAANERDTDDPAKDAAIAMARECLATAKQPQPKEAP